MVTRKFSRRIKRIKTIGFKMESGNSIPDLTKILKMAEILAFLQITY